MRIFEWPADRAEILRFFAQASTTPPEVERAVDAIIADVAARGDAAVADLTERFDGIRLAPNDFDVPADRLAESWAAAPPDLKRALRTARRRIESFHKRQRLAGWTVREPGFGRIDQRIIPLQRVGVYVPGGKAPLVSTVLMNVIPARVAGVDEIVLVTPPGPGGWPDAGILAAAHLVGVDRVLRIGGSPAIPALAFGTDTIPRVDKVVGPGNIYVATAKQRLFGRIDIESVAGPSEIMVLADKDAPLPFIAADLLAQAEHDGHNPAGAVLIGGDRRRAEALVMEVATQLARLSRRELAQSSIDGHGYIILAANREDAVELANLRAPEHLEIMVEHGGRKMAGQVRHAGAIFLGRWTPESVGDYIAGPNHTLPTGGTARFFSPLGVWSFYRMSHTIKATRDGLAAVAPEIETLAEAEQLTAHAEAVRVRLRHRDRDAR